MGDEAELWRAAAQEACAILGGARDAPATPEALLAAARRARAQNAALRARLGTAQTVLHAQADLRVSLSPHTHHTKHHTADGTFAVCVTR